MQVDKNKREMNEWSYESIGYTLSRKKMRIDGNKAHDLPPENVHSHYSDSASLLSQTKRRFSSKKICSMQAHAHTYMPMYIICIMRVVVSVSKIFTVRIKKLHLVKYKYWYFSLFHARRPTNWLSVKRRDGLRPSTEYNPDSICKYYILLCLKLYIYIYKILNSELNIFSYQ